MDNLTGAPGPERRDTTSYKSDVELREKAMDEHLKNFPINPSHYRRVHVPLRIYLTKELSITFMSTLKPITRSTQALVTRPTGRGFVPKMYHLPS